jgi:hypothetical protein
MLSAESLQRCRPHVGSEHDLALAWHALQCLPYAFAQHGQAMMLCLRATNAMLGELEGSGSMAGGAQPWCCFLRDLCS